MRRGRRHCRRRCCCRQQHCRRCCRSPSGPAAPPSRSSREEEQRAPCAAGGWCLPRRRRSESEKKGSSLSPRCSERNSGFPPPLSGTLSLTSKETRSEPASVDQTKRGRSALARECPARPPPRRTSASRRSPRNSTPPSRGSTYSRVAGTEEAAEQQRESNRCRRKPSALPLVLRPRPRLPLLLRPKSRPSAPAPPPTSPATAAGLPARCLPAAPSPWRREGSPMRGSKERKRSCGRRSGQTWRRGPRRPRPR